jgi:hypothetical protein
MKRAKANSLVRSCHPQFRLGTYCISDITTLSWGEKLCNSYNTLCTSCTTAQPHSKTLEEYINCATRKIWEQQTILPLCLILFGLHSRGRLHSLLRPTSSSLRRQVHTKKYAQQVSALIVGPLPQPRGRNDPAKLLSTEEEEGGGYNGV